MKYKISYNYYMEFKEWFLNQYLKWQELEGEHKTMSEFAEFLGVTQPYVSSWMNGYYKPGKKYIPLLSEKLGNEIYSMLGMSPPNLLSNAPPEFKSKFLAAMREANKRYLERGEITEEEAESILFEIMRKHGFKTTAIE